jgi:ABC-type multidrug transport system fused ATPase/permease subunit
LIEFFKRFGPYFKDYISRFVWATVGSVMVAVSTGAVAWLVKHVLDDIFIAKDRTLLFLLPPIVVVLYLMQGAGATCRPTVLPSARTSFAASMTMLTSSRSSGSAASGRLISRVTNDTPDPVTVSWDMSVLARKPCRRR